MFFLFMNNKDVGRPLKLDSPQIVIVSKVQQQNIKINCANA